MHVITKTIISLSCGKFKNALMYTIVYKRDMSINSKFYRIQK